ncbi:hypothetical protein EDD15DRAFT_2376651 [Pisolithus albus]|nr:hypothetical protein EDD15DRAFT_2376651 [Pisolithus albus]
MNQPTGSCYGSMAGEMGLLTADNIFEDTVDRGAEEVEVTDAAGWHYDDEDINMGVPHADTLPPFPDYSPAPSVGSYGGQHEQLPGTGRFFETYEGCVETFPGGETFMDQFWNDGYAEKRRENIYFPWASRQEWAFASWLLRSRLSMAAIDSLLSLEIIKTVPLSFRSAKELRTRAEILPPGP